MIIEEERLLEIIKLELPATKYLKFLPNIENMILHQATKESSLFIYSTRYEPNLNDFSIGLFQILTKTIEWLDFTGDYLEMFEDNVQVKYAIKYLDYLYSKFPEIKNIKERTKIMFSAYNCGKATINKCIKRGLADEQIYYNGANTTQGKWSTYKNINKMMIKYNITSNKNAEINKRYVDYITKGLIK